MTQTTTQNPEAQKVAPAQIIEKNGRHEETRTPDLYRVNFDLTPLKLFSSLAFPGFLKSKLFPNALVLVTNW